MTINQHLTTAVRRLMAEKATIEQHIRDEMRRPIPDSLTLQSLKRLRLALKDRVTHLLASYPIDALPIPARTN